MRLGVTGLLALVLLASCGPAENAIQSPTSAAAASQSATPSGVVTVRLDLATVDALSTPHRPEQEKTSLPSANAVYHVGVGDILDVVVWDHPELTSPAGANRTPEESGLRVQADGTFFYPYVGQMQAEGLTPERIRDALTASLATYIPNPQVEVRVVGYKSQAVSVTGEVSHPSRQAVTDTGLTLLDAISAAGGLTENADTKAIKVRRSGKTYQVNLRAFLEDGIGQNNPVLASGDVVNVPRLLPLEAYLLGQVGKPSTIDLSHEDITLTQALARSGGLREDSADARGIFVFRKTAQGVTVYQLDVENPASYLAGTRFMIQPQDVIYVTTAPIARWNRMISNLLPTLNVGATASKF